MEKELSTVLGKGSIEQLTERERAVYDILMRLESLGLIRVTPSAFDKVMMDMPLNDDNTKYGKMKKLAREDIKRIVKFLNDNYKRGFKVLPALADKLFARYKDGFTYEEILSAIINAHRNQYHIETKFRYLTPAFFLRAEMIEKWKQELSVEVPDEPPKDKPWIVKQYTDKKRNRFIWWDTKNRTIWKPEENKQ